MTETQAGITENSDDISLREWIAKHSNHIDQGIHEIRQLLQDTADEVSAIHAQVSEIHSELETARPLLEKWQHSKIRKLATGQMPWGGA